MKLFNTIVKPTYEMLSPAFRKRSFFIIALMVVQALLDFINITAFLPLLILITKPEVVTALPWVQPYVSNYSHSELLLILTGSILVFTLLKSVVVWKITAAKANFAFGVAHDISLRIVTNQLHCDYLRFVGADFSKEMNRAANLPFAFSNNIIIGLTTLISEGLVGLLIIISISFLNFKLLLSLLLILLPLGMIYLLSRQKIKQ